MSAIDLNQKGISINGSEFNAIAPNLQSNIVKSHARDHVRILFLQYNAAKPVRAWIKNFINQEKFVVSAMDQKADTDSFKRSGISKTVVNFYLSAKGYEKLGFDTGKFTEGFTNIDDDDNEDDETNENVIFGNMDFVRGMKSNKVNDKLEDPNPDQWEQGYNTDIHAMVLLADDDESRLNAETDKVRNSLKGLAMVIREEKGKDLSETIESGKKLHIEHFGYADGISQPRYFKEDTKSSPFDLQPLNILLVKDPFTSNNDENYGSFLVYRKLEQDIDGFNKKVAELAGHLDLNSNQKGKITEEDYAGALVVGRFKDGTPIIQSDIKLGQSPAFNDFRYESMDRNAHKCPFHAHIRKANPRGQGILVSLKGRFITRRGIPYGNRNSAEKKGLLFMCFQANLKRQFNFIQKTWANAPGFPPLRGKPGIDPLIGQGYEGGQSWPKQYDNREEIKFNFAGFVKMKGGEYFFAPSIGFLKNL